LKCADLIWHPSEHYATYLQLIIFGQHSLGESSMDGRRNGCGGGSLPILLNPVLKTLNKEFFRQPILFVGPVRTVYAFLLYSILSYDN